jgi:hypothetical protein
MDVREVSQTAGTAGTNFRLVRLFWLAGIRFRLNRLARNDTVIPVQETIHLFHDVVSNYLSPRYMSLQASIKTSSDEK